MLGLRIKKFIEEKGMTFSYVAKNIGMTATTFSSMLNGKRKITAEEYFSICRTLNVNLDYFNENSQQERVSV